MAENLNSVMSCRLCLTTEAAFLPIFELSNSEIGDIPIALKIAVCVSIPVTQYDIFSKLICSTCYELVDQFYSFRESCLANYVSLQLLCSGPKEVILGEEDLMENAPDIPEEPCSEVNITTAIELPNLVDTIKMDDLTSSYDDDVTLDQTDYEVGGIEEVNIASEVNCEDEDDNCALESPEINDSPEETVAMETLVLDYATVEKEGEEFQLKEENYPCDDRGYEEICVYGNNYSRSSSACDEEYTVSDADVQKTVYGSDQLTDNIEPEEFDNSDQANRFVCEVCSEIFDSLNELNEHQESCFEGMEDDLAKEPSVTADAVQSDISHYLVLNLPKPAFFTGTSAKSSGKSKRSCDLCHKSFGSPNQLAAHIRTHTGERPFSCDVCQRAFSQLGALRNHQNQHTNNFPYECKVCKKGFCRPSDVSKHLRIHTNERPYKCSFCDLRFHQLSGLTVHERTHSGERPYSCNICQMSFTQLSNKYRHMKTHVGGLKPFTCRSCYKKFADFDEFELHRQAHTGGSPRLCPFCGQAFQKQSQLRDHLRRVHTNDRPFTCELCSKSFFMSSDLKSHLLVHTGERPYSCDHCQQAFTQVSNLKRHKRRCHKAPMQATPEMILPNNLYDVESLDMDNMDMLQFDHAEL